MCLIITKPFGIEIPENHIKTAYDSNRDGIGISIRRLSGGVPLVYKYLTLKEFIDNHKDDLKNPDIEAVIHLRFGTHGSVTINNVHPFKTPHNYAFHHNGILSIKPKGDKTDSETYMLERFIKSAFCVKSDVFKKTIEKEIGASKFALHTDEGVILFNEKHGHWLNGAWYSNYGYESYDMGWTTVEDPFSEELDIVDLLRDYLPDTNPIKKDRLINLVEAYIDECWQTEYAF